VTKGKIISNSKNMSQDRVADVVIVTALQSEYKAVLRYLDSPQKLFKNRTVHKAYLQHEDSQTGYQVVVVCFGGMGNVQSATTVTQLINDWKPAAIILTGIMAGVNPSKQKLGDLIVAEQIVGYELAKVKNTGTTPRFETLRPTRMILDKVRHFQDDQWKMACLKLTLPDGETRQLIPQVHFGVVASGDKVIADQTTVLELQRSWSSLMGVEMEGFGTANSVHQAPFPVEILMVKGICDWADADKNDKWQAYAANVAAAYVVNFLKSKPIDCKVLPNPLSRTRRTFLQAGLAGVVFVCVVVSRSLGNNSPQPATDKRSSPTLPNDTPSPLPPSQTRQPEPPAPKTPAPKVSSNPLKIVQFETVTVNSTGEITKRSQSQAQVFTETIAKGITLEMMAIPGGSFVMGSPNTEARRYQYEGPQRTVNVAAFFMGKYQVTQAQWLAVADLPKVKIDLNPNPSGFKGDNLPVESVSWDDATEFCARLSQFTGRNYRLPSEAEWEYACRAGTTTPFYFGDTVTPHLVNYQGTVPYGSAPQGIYREKTTDVGSFPPNTFGLCDMHGNVWEWCQDVWHDNYNGVPTDGSAWETGGDSKNRVWRGASWDNHAIHCRAAYRYFNSSDNSGRYVGFRVIRA
jgi:formylglycine-generating enzyme required for sulfatase activity/nucleoside phosphorylase